MSRVSLPTLADSVGGLSEPSKMPWWGYSLPAAECRVGSRLRDTPGSVCHDCYALGHHYRYDNVQDALYRRLQLMKEDPEGWADRMARLLIVKAGRFIPTAEDPRPSFRWHDSGDLQGVWHLDAINYVAGATRLVRLGDGSRKAIRHWLPTREYGLVAEWFEGGGTLAPNLTVRLSAHLVDGPAPLVLARKWGLVVSTVHTTPEAYPAAAVCPAPHQGNACGSCRNCWDRRVPHVSYAKH